MEEKRNSMDINYLFVISEAIKEFYETPVIFFTRKDYSDKIFNTYCAIRKAILDNASKADLVDAIVDFNLEWLRDINDIEHFKNRMKDISREEVYESIYFTIDALCNRRKHFQRYVDKYFPSLPNNQIVNMRTELEIIEDMHKETVKLLLEQLKCFKDNSCNMTFHCKLNEAVEDLSLWFDNISDKLAFNISSIINYKRPTLHGDLPRALQHVVHEFSNKRSEAYLRILGHLEEKGRTLSFMVRGIRCHSIEIAKVTLKIEDIDKQLQNLEREQTSAIEELENKRRYLKDRLARLEKKRISLKQFNDKHDVTIKNREEEEICDCEEFYHLRIFNHLLPLKEREDLIMDLCQLWSLGVLGQAARKPKSLSSILSATGKETHTDELGTYVIDEYSRNIYSKPGDETKYQKNEKGELVPLSDDAERVYFFDKCGRYFIDQTLREKIYKAHDTASEYMMGLDHCLMKTKEVRDGTTYYYDVFGRYYYDEDGRRLYKEEDGASEYEPDGFGNLVRLRPGPKYHDTCPDIAHVSEECRYLKRSIGVALKICIANTVCLRPADPIKCLVANLIKYRRNEEDRLARIQEREKLQVQRDIKVAEEKAERDRLAQILASIAAMSFGGESTRTSDSYFNTYAHLGE